MSVMWLLFAGILGAICHCDLSWYMFLHITKQHVKTNEGRHVCNVRLIWRGGTQI